MSRTNVKHTPLPAEDFDDPTSERDRRRRPVSVNDSNNMTDEHEHEQFSELDDSEPQSPDNSADLNFNNNNNHNHNHNHNNSNVNETAGRRSACGVRPSQARASSVRPSKQQRKRKVRDQLGQTKQNNGNAGLFHQVHTLNFLPPPPPRDTPSIASADSQSLLGSNAGAGVGAVMTLARNSTVQLQNGSVWNGTLKSVGNQRHPAAPVTHNFQPYASTTLLNMPAENNMYYLSSANQSLLQPAEDAQLFDFAGNPVVADAAMWGNVPKLATVGFDTASSAHTINVGYPASNVSFASAQHTPLLQPTFLKNANFGGSQNQCVLPAGGALQGQLIMDDNANTTLLTNQQAAAFAGANASANANANANTNTNGSSAQYETLPHINANRTLDTANMLRLLNGTDPLRQPMAGQTVNMNMNQNQNQNQNQRDFGDAARAFLDYNSKYAVKYVDDSVKRASFCSWKTAAIISVMLCAILVPVIIYFCVNTAKTEVAEDSSLSEWSSANLQTDSVVTPLRVQLKPYRMWYAQCISASSSSALHDAQSSTNAKRLYKLRIAFREPDSYYRLAVFFQNNYRPTALRYEDRFVLAKEDTYDVNNGTKMLVTVNTKQRREVDVSLFKSLGDSGTWFIGLYSDTVTAFSVSLSFEQVTINSTADGGNDCRGYRNCNSAGLCIEGTCACFPGYTGDFCEPRTCPVLCNGRGFYYRGACQCYPPFSGLECDNRLDDPCSNVNCNNHGTCRNGRCVCDLPYSGATCNEVTCKPHNCNGNGHCLAGSCRCYHGWTGEDCGVPVQASTAAIIETSSSCGRNGVYDPVNKQCACNSGYTGMNCESKLCSLPCLNGLCLNGRCECEPGWSGRLCDFKECSALCAEHGRCMNGTCECADKYYGVHCNHEMCPNNCNNFGICSRNGSVYSCRCAEGRSGEACEFAAEVCDDGIDNDGDTLVDCADPECCSSQRCLLPDTGASTCIGMLAPEDAVLVRTKPARFPSFFDNTKAFFADEYSSAAVQQYAKGFAFQPTLASIVFGYVSLRGNEGFAACRIAVPERLSEYGYVSSRQKGRFDMVVNGGQFVTFQISCRDDRLVRYVTTYVAPNTFVRLPNVDFDDNDITRVQNGRIATSAAVESVNAERVVTCSRFPHNPIKNRPRIYVQSNVPAYSNRADASCDGDSSLSVTRLIPERRSILETLRIPDTNFHLVWSNTQNKYGLLVIMQLTPVSITQLDSNLNFVHLTINFAGNDAKVVRHRFVARSNLTFTYIWSRRDSYGQSRYGLTTAYVAVGYEYISCPGRVFWERQTLVLPSDILLPVAYGGWSIDAVHEYNPVDGVLIRGDSSAVYYRLLPKLVKTVVGSKSLRQRPVDCPSGGVQCYALFNVEASKLQWHSILQILPDSFGNVWVADHNLIRYVQFNASNMRVTVRTVYEMPVYTQLKLAPEPYYFALNAAEGQLYVSDPLQKLIFRLNLSDSIYWRQTSETQKRPSWKPPSVETVAGTGEQCQPGFSCGDVGSPLVPLYQPKAIALDKFGTLYFIDGSLLRRIKKATNELETVIGNAQLPTGAYSRPSKEPLCVGDLLPFSELELLWPSAMRYSTYEDVMYLISHNHVLLRLYLADSIALVVASNCAKRGEDSMQLLASFTSVVDFSIHDNGNIIVLERLRDRGNRITEIKTDGSATVLMNFRDEVSSDVNQNQDGAQDTNNAKTHLNMSSFINLNTVGYLSSGEFLLGEATQSVLHQAYFDLPELTVHETNGRQDLQYRIRDPTSKDVFVFNVAGKHTMTLHGNSQKKYQLESGKMTEFSTSGEQISQSRISAADRSNVPSKNSHTVYQIETVRNRETKRSLFYVDQKFNLVRFESDSYVVSLRYGPPDSETLLSEKTVTTATGAYNYSFTYDRNDMLASLTVPDGQTKAIALELQPVRFHVENGTLSYLITTDQQRSTRIQAPFGGVNELEIDKDWYCGAVNVTASVWKWQRANVNGGEQNVRVLTLSSFGSNRRQRLA